jgi:hypothetical protein
MAGVDTIETLVREFAALLERLRRLSSEVAKQELSEPQLREVIARLRAAGTWTDANDATVRNMVLGGGYDEAKAFQTLTAGSAPVQAVVAAVLAGEPAPDPPAQTIVEPDVVEMARRRGRGRPRHDG